MPPKIIKGGGEGAPVARPNPVAKSTSRDVAIRSRGSTWLTVLAEWHRTERANRWSELSH